MPTLGRIFEPEEISRGAQVVLIGQTVARNLYGGIDPIGQELRIRNVPFRVIGVMSRKGQSTWGQDQDDVVFIPLNTARQRVLGRNLANARAVGSIYVKVRDGEDMTLVEDEVKSLLRQRHRMQPGQEDDFSIRNLADIAATREASARTLAMLLAAVAGVSLAVGGIGIMNIMLVSVTERTREIGLRLAVGARQWDILRQFLFEATGLAAIGGLIGVLFGVGAAYRGLERGRLAAADPAGIDRAGRGVFRPGRRVLRLVSGAARLAGSIRSRRCGIREALSPRSAEPALHARPQIARRNGKHGEQDSDDDQRNPQQHQSGQQQEEQAATAPAASRTRMIGERAGLLQIDPADAVGSFLDPHEQAVETAARIVPPARRNDFRLDTRTLDAGGIGIVARHASNVV